MSVGLTRISKSADDWQVTPTVELLSQRRGNAIPHDVHLGDPVQEKQGWSLNAATSVNSGPELGCRIRQSHRTLSEPPRTNRELALKLRTLAPSNDYEMAYFRTVLNKFVSRFCENRST